MHLPALLGGTPERPQGPPHWPPADPEIQEVLQEAYRGGWWGKYLAGQSECLEALLKEMHQVEQVLLCGSGNYAVELGLRALSIGAGAEVILADYDYPGNFLSILAVGATPVLVDVEPRSWNLSLEAVRAAIGPATRAILASHLHGGRVPMPALLTLARTHGLLVVEDAAQAPGAMLQDRRAGTWGDVGILSFGGSKLLAAGRGGALLTSRADVAQRARQHLLRAGNIVCPLSELQAALLIPQCRRLDERNALRWRNVQALCQALGNRTGLRPLVQDSEAALPAFYKLGLQLDESTFGLPRSLFIAALRAEGFAVDEGFSTAHGTRSPKRYRQGGELTEAARAQKGCVQLHHPLLLETPETVCQFAAACRKIQEHAPALRASARPSTPAT